MERNYNQTILKVIAQKLGVDESDVLPQSELVADFGADSLDLVEIMMKLEVVFDIKVSDDEMDSLRTVQDCYDLVEQKLKSEKP